MKPPLGSVLIAITTVFFSNSLPPCEGAEALQQSGNQPESGSLKYGMNIQFSLVTFGNPGEALTPEQFAPTDLNVKSWVQNTKMAGMDFAILKAKVASGFCLWDSKDYAYDIAHSPVKVDIIADFIAACTAQGVVPGVLYSIADAYNEGQVRRSGPVPPPYFDLIKRQITELHSRYRNIKIQVFGNQDRLSKSQLDQLRQIIKQFNPQCLILGDTEGFPGSAYEEATVIKEYLWRPDAHLNSASDLYAKYTQCRESGHTFLLNVAPDRTGRIPQAQINVLLQLKSLIANPPAKRQTGAEPVTKLPPAERLKQVKALYDQGLISKEDYDKKVKEIMDSL